VVVVEQVVAAGTQTQTPLPRIPSPSRPLDPAWQEPDANPAFLHFIN
jgi:hypothetical protein